MSLQELVSRSQHAMIGTPLLARCRYLTIGGRRWVITETQLRVEGALALEPLADMDVVVRTLGGQLDGIGEMVHGQADFQQGRQCVGFLERAADSAYWVTGMAQGHYPLDRMDAAPVLQASPQLPTIRDWEQSAVKRLVGTRLSEAESLIAEAKSR